MNQVNDVNMNQMLNDEELETVAGGSLGKVVWTLVKAIAIAFVGDAIVDHATRH
jgi:hypothetical protein